MIRDIIFDADGVLLDWNSGLSHWLSLFIPGRMGVDFSFPLDKERGVHLIPYGLVLAFHGSQHFSEIPPMPGAQKAVSRLLAEGGRRMFVLTAVEDEAAEARRECLSRNFPGAFLAIETSHPRFGKENALKSMFFKYGIRPREAAFVDDMIPNIRTGLKLGLNMVCMENGANMPLPPDIRHVPAVKNLSEFAAMVALMDGKRTASLPSFQACR